MTAKSHERDAEAARLHALGYTYDQIAAELGCSHGTAFNAVRRVHRAAGAEARDQIREAALSRIEAVAARMEQIADGDHRAVAQGRVVLDENGEPVFDASPVIAASKVLLETVRDVRKLLGLDEQPVQKVDQTSTVRYEVVGLEGPDTPVSASE